MKTSDKDLPFDNQEYLNRLDRVREKMNSNKIDFLLINDPVDLNYLLGYRSWGFSFLDWQVLIISLQKEPVLVTRILESTNYKNQTLASNIVTFSDEEDPIAKTIDVLNELGVQNKQIGLPFGSNFMSAKHINLLKNKLSETVTLVDGTDILMNCRLIKSDQEILYIRQAASITSKVMKTVKESPLTNPTENELAQQIMSNLIAMGSELPATPPFIGVGKRSTYGHPVWENYQSGKGDVIFLEFSGCIHRYHAPIMRTMCIGEPSDKVKKFEKASLGLINEITQKTEIGMKVSDVDSIAKSYLSKINMSHYFHNRIGYSVGIGFTKWVDGVSIKNDVDIELKENMVFHIIPFITDFEISVAISESVLITKNGMEKLTDVPQEVLVFDS